MTYKITLNEKVYEVSVEQGEAILVNVADVAVAAPVAAAPAPAAPTAAAAPAPAPAATLSGEVVPSPLPGTIVEVKVAVGQAVTKGQVLVRMEAMKMENEVKSPRDGTVAQIITSKGASVNTGTPLLTLS